MFSVELIYPEGDMLKTDALAVTLPGVLGSFQILPGHAAIVSVLEKGLLKIRPKEYFTEENLPDGFVLLEGGVLAVEIKGGTAEFSEGRLVVLMK